MNTVHHIVTVGLWRAKSEGFFDAIQKCLRWFFINAHGAIALHVGVTADGTSAGALLGDTPLDKQ